MHGDFSLNPLAYRNRVSRVLAQQGRVQLDSDWNEQTESFLRFLRGLAIDVIGHHGGVGDSFAVLIDDATSEVRITWGEYYVDGIRCVNFPANVDLLDVLERLIAQPAVKPQIGDGVLFHEQSDYFPADDKSPLEGQKNEKIFFYLDVIERHVSSAEDDSIREVALLGAETASRAVVVWRVRAMLAEQFEKQARDVVDLKLEGLPGRYDPNYLALNMLLRTNVRLRAQAIETHTTDPCTIAPDARFRGTDNRLFRVEIHDPKVPSFKWSPDNGAIVYPIAAAVEGKTVRLESLGRDQRTQLCVNDWVEVVDDAVFMDGPSNPLLQVIDIRRSDMTVVLSDEPANDAGQDMKRNPILRRWSTAEITIEEAKGPRDHWYELADGVEVQFSTAGGATPRYRRGDYWLVPARTATGDVIWPRDPKDDDLAAAVLPHGIEHHYAPLATCMRDAGKLTTKDLRWVFEKMAKPAK